MREGKLFLAESSSGDQDLAPDGHRQKTLRREHFWLCEACCAHFTLRFDSDHGMMTVPLSPESNRRWVPALA
jgi:hypothetical protein